MRFHLNERDEKFLRIHSASISFNNEMTPLHINCGCTPGKAYLTGRIIACDEPEVIACALRRLTT